MPLDDDAGAEHLVATHPACHGMPTRRENGDVDPVIGKEPSGQRQTPDHRGTDVAEECVRRHPPGVRVNQPTMRGGGVTGWQHHSPNPVIRPREIPGAKPPIRDPAVAGLTHGETSAECGWEGTGAHHPNMPSHRPHRVTRAGDGDKPRPGEEGQRVPSTGIGSGACTLPPDRTSDTSPWPASAPTSARVTRGA